MAITATIALSPSTVQLNQPTLATLTISNSGGSAVNILEVQPTVIPTGASDYKSSVPFAAGTTIPGGNAQSVSVPPSGSLVLKFPFTFFDPSTASSTYDCGALIFDSAGGYTRPTAATVTVNQLSFNDAAPGFPINP